MTCRHRMKFAERVRQISFCVYRYLHERRQCILHIRIKRKCLERLLYLFLRVPRHDQPDSKTIIADINCFYLLFRHELLHVLPFSRNEWRDTCLLLCIERDVNHPSHKCILSSCFSCGTHCHFSIEKLNLYARQTITLTNRMSTILSYTYRACCEIEGRK